MPVSIPLNQLLAGHLYRIHSRNLRQGVYDGDGGFIGVREKFGFRYLATEYAGETATAYEYLGPIPEDIPISEELGTIDRRSGRRVASKQPVAGEAYVWYYLNSGLTDEDIEPVVAANTQLFDYLESLRPANVPNDRTLAAQSRLRKHQG